MSSIKPNGALPSTSTAAASIAIKSSTTMAAAAINTVSGTVPNFKKKKYVALWDTDGLGIDSWISTVSSPFRNSVGRATSVKKDAAIHNPSSSVKSNTVITPEILELTWNNMRTAIDELRISLRPPTDTEIDQDNSSLPAKRQKIAADGGDDPSAQKNYNVSKKKPKEIYAILDPLNLYLHTIRIIGDGASNDDNEDLIQIEDDAARDIKTTTGGKLSQLTVSGIINGLSGNPGGIVNKKNQALPSINIKILEAIPTAGNASLTVLQKLAQDLYRSIQIQIEADVLVTTPGRIQEMLASDLSNAEFKSIRKRIYDTAVLGKGLSQPEGIDIPTANNQGVHALEKFKKCVSCGATDQSVFVLDRKNGDVICSSCGTVNSESLMHEGSQFRKFEGEADRNHHGDTQNPLYSNAHNMSTGLGGIQPTSGAGVGGFGSNRGHGLETILRNAHAYTELNISQFGKGDRRTRTGYKDKQKKDAFIKMANVGDALNLHEAVVQRGKELFAGFRDDRELIQQFKGVIAACLCEAFEQLSSAGRSIIKQKQATPAETMFANSRANRRNELHHAKLAGKGGLLLDMDSISKDNENKGADALSVTNKAISSWSVEDCRSWLMEVSSTVAHSWIEERKKGITKHIPEGSIDELTGKMVEHSITLCAKLESDLKNYAKKKTALTSGGRRRVVTPRLNDMAKLGIKWQHSHERGSGGKGGVGGSGKSQPERSGRTAGQILILKSSNKIGQMVDNRNAGEAIHKQLRLVVNKQAALKRQKLSDEATRQRFLQMKRKPWLQARAMIDK